MEDLSTCSKCYKSMELQYFSMNYKGEPYKRCQSCNKKRNDYFKIPKYQEYVKRYYQENQEHINQMKRQWLQDNKDRLSVNVVCEICGTITHRCSQPQHKKTLKCKEALKNKLNTPLCEFYLI